MRRASVTRRELILKAAAAFTALRVAGWPLSVAALGRVETDEANWMRVRDMFQTDRNIVHLNSAALGAVPRLRRSVSVSKRPPRLMQYYVHFDAERAA